MKTLCAVLLLGLASHLHARIGETEAQLEARFGKPIMETEGTIAKRASVYVFGPFTVIIEMDDEGKSAAEVYARKQGAELSEAEAGAIMRDQGQEKKWEIQPVQNRRFWRTEDGSLGVELMQDKPVRLVVSTTVYAEKWRQRTLALLRAEMLKVLDKMTDPKDIAAAKQRIEKLNDPQLTQKLAEKVQGK